VRLRSLTFRDVKPVVGVTGIAVGAGLVGIGAWCLYGGLVNGRTEIEAAWDAYYASTTDHDVLYAAYEDAIGAAAGRSRLGGVLLAGGVVLVGGGVVLVLPSRAPSAPAAAVGILPSRSGAVLSLVVRY
jgi:hypothetical protein